MRPVTLFNVARVSIPLMLAAMSGTVLVFIDRAVLANYSIEAMNAATLSGIAFAIFQASSVSIAAIAEVFVGQYHGAGLHKRLAAPVWQMLYFSLATTLIFVPLYFLTPLFLPDQYVTLGNDYLSWLFLAGPLFPAVAAVAAYFVAQHRVQLVSYSFLIASLLNFGLDLLLIFGWDPWVPEFGIRGAAIATIISQLINFLILFFFFIKETHLDKKGRLFNKPLFWAEIKLGMPTALGKMIEVTGWTFSLNLIAYTSDMHLTLASFGQNMWILLAFIGEGLHKGVVAFASNLVGAQQTQHMPLLLKKGFQLSLIIFSVFGVLFVVFPELIAKIYFTDDITPMLPLLNTALFFVWCGIAIDAMMWVIAGILLSQGDSRFILFLGTVSTWVFGVLPSYIFIYHLKGPPMLTVQLWTAWSVINFALFFWRYRNRMKRLSTTSSLVFTH